MSKQLPEHRFSQEDVSATLQEHWQKQHANPARVEQFHRSVQVQSRYLALSKDEYAQLGSFTAANDAFIRVGTDLGARAVADALAQVDLAPSDVDVIFFTTVTGLAVPTIDARLVNRLGLRRDVKRVPLFGLGCLAGAAGLARVHDYLRGWPDHVAVLLAVELCSLTVQTGDLSVPNLIATGLFGDGAAAVVAVGPARERIHKHRVPRVVASKSAFYYDTERVMGWDIGSSGFKIVLDASVPKFAETYLGPDLDAFLAEQGLGRSAIKTWVCHPGGPKVLTAMAAALALPDDALALTWRSLEQVGNLSSASVLFVLADTMAQRAGASQQARAASAPAHSAAPAADDYGIILALGPGFCAEMVLFQW